MSRQRDLDRFEPPALDRLREALEFLHRVAYPHMASSPSGGGRGGSVGHPLDQAEAERIVTDIAGGGRAWTPDSIRARHRRALTKHLQRIERLTADVLADAETRDEPKAQPRRCVSCDHKQRFGARYCDRCGCDLKTGNSPLAEQAPHTP